MANSDVEIHDVIIIGAGVAGLAAARKLVAHEKSVVLLEKSKGVGGRMATRRLGGQSIDHGAQFFTTKTDGAFRQLCREWLFSGVIKPWFGKPGQVRYCGIKSINAVAKELASGLDIRNEQRVTGLSYADGIWDVACDNGDRFKGRSVVCTAPAPQALEVVENSDLSLESETLEALANVRYERCIALLALLDEPSGMIAPGILKLEADSVFMTISDTLLKGTSRQPGIVALSSHAWALENYDRDEESLERELLEALQERIDIEPRETYLHKWRFAHRVGDVGECRYLRSGKYPIWFAGDSFGEAKVEGAYLSGLEAAESIVSE